MTEQWQELKETITEMRDNDGTGTQQEVCKFLTNYMEILEKQMQQSCEDCISRKAMWKVVHECETHNSPSWVWREMLSQLPSVTPKAESNNTLAEIRAEILDEAEYAYADFDRYKEDILHAEPDELPDDDFRYGLERAVEIINKYKAGSKDICLYHGIKCDYKGGCINCPHNTVEDTEWFRQDEERAESEEEE